MHTNRKFAVVCGAIEYAPEYPRTRFVVGVRPVHRQFVHSLQCVDILQKVSSMYSIVRPSKFKRSELYLQAAGSPGAPLNANEAEIEARSLQVPRCETRGVKCSGDH